MALRHRHRGGRVGDVLDGRVHAGLLEPLDQPPEALELLLDEGMTYNVGSCEVAPQTLDPQTVESPECADQVGDSIQRDTYSVHAGVEFEMHADPAAPLRRRLCQAGREGLRVDGRRDLVIQQGGDSLRWRLRKEVNGSADPRLSEMERLGHSRHSEALHLREAGIGAPIHLFTEPPPQAIAALLDHEITPTVYTQSFAAGLAEAASQRGCRVGVHLKLDTGMNRVGVPLDAVADLVRTLRRLDGLWVEGLWSHFATADVIGHPFVKEQLERFWGL